MVAPSGIRNWLGYDLVAQNFVNDEALERNRKKNNVKVGFEQQLSKCFLEYFECNINCNLPLRNVYLVKGFQNNVPNIVPFCLWGIMNQGKNG
jgi:hypothetical protein